jgi:hypothetical protein
MYFRYPGKKALAKYQPKFAGQVCKEKRFKPTATHRSRKSQLANGVKNFRIADAWQ